METFVAVDEPYDGTSPEDDKGGIQFARDQDSQNSEDIKHARAVWPFTVR